MSTTYPDADSLRIPPKPRMARARPAHAAALQPVLQMAVSAAAAFALAWLLSHLIIG
ncbi:hypothetical protein KTR66_06915 [Roseococcus sp. SDR]|uniref:hypothetical protein n=1 Tax=Roseococcus sp. SDR TaxID=2835532 RepID=UPI001BCF3512|nr:hypothetical protein [Roseococcus sp. SDR]MBS7789717.1 hypothetical protein [Roseococcus sp. SDR]MBV1845031.1 hypothetical protein [Roseococcus sp. SDR]